MAATLRQIPRILPKGSGNGDCTSLTSGISILSYNILLPNSVDGWWCYKMYSPRHNIPIQSTLWESRVALLESDVKVANCDVVCFQETAAGSFDNDFKFMQNLGYDHCELYKKGRFRPATFWKSNRVELKGQPLHRDRILITCFKSLDNTTAETTAATKKESIENYIYIANCHLQAGNNAVRRLRQTHDCLEAISKDQKKQFPSVFANNNNKGNKSNSSNKKGNTAVSGSNSNSSNTVTISNSPTFSYLFTGDMNVDGDIERTTPSIHTSGDHQTSASLSTSSSSAVEVLLTQGSLPARYLEDGVEISEKVKSQKVGHFKDVYAFAYAQQQHQQQENRLNSFVNNNVAMIVSTPPPTMVVENLYGVLTSTKHIVEASNGSNINLKKDDVGLWESHSLSTLGLDLMNKVFDSFATATITDTTCNTSGNNADSKSSINLSDSNITSNLEQIMNCDDVAKWLIKINHQVGRGSEYRAALAAMKKVSPSYQSSLLLLSQTADATANKASSISNVTKPLVATEDEVNEDTDEKDGNNNNNDDDANNNSSSKVIEPLPLDGYLNRQSFLDIYNEEIELGKVWGVAADLAACGYPLLPTSTETFQARYDRAYLAGAASIVAVRDTGGRETVCLPNENYPSDHLPIMMILEW